MIKTALTAAIVLTTASVAFASEFDPNLANRYPGFARSRRPVRAGALQTRNVALTGQVAVKTIDRAGANHDGSSHRLRRAIAPLTRSAADGCETSSPGTGALDRFNSNSRLSRAGCSFFCGDDFAQHDDRHCGRVTQATLRTVTLSTIDELFSCHSSRCAARQRGETLPISAQAALHR